MKRIGPYKRAMLVAFITLCSALGLFADVELLQSTIVDNNALNFSSSAASFNRNINGRTYQRFPMATSKGYQYATYYDEDRYVCLARRKLPDGAWDVIRFTDYTINSHDSHNVVSVGICEKDGTIHLMFDHHKHDLNYRVSNIGVASNPESVTWSTGLFSPITDNLGSVGKITQLTYPSFFNAPNGNLMLYYRYGGSGSGDGMIQEYNGTTHDWTIGLGKFISRWGDYTGAYSTTTSTSRNPYINGISYGGDRLHATWGWRETSTSAASNHDLNYAYSDDNGRTWRNNTGTLIGTTGSSYISINSPGLIAAAIPQNIGLSNQYTHYAFPDGSCHVMVAHNNKYQHYWRNAAGAWSQGTLSFKGSRPKMCGDDDGNLFLVYEDGGKPRIAKGVPNASQTAWSWSLVYTQNVSEGGEGQLDYSRWEADRVLSFYGQEEPPNTSETPSPLHIYDYKVSTTAILPVPVHEAAVTNLGLTLEWTAGIDAVSHRVYLGTDSNAVAAATTASPEYMGEQASTSFTPAGGVDGQTRYYWRIDEVSAGAVVRQGLLWSFTTWGDTVEISAVPDQAVVFNTTPVAIPFTVSFGTNSADALVVTGTSSNTTLVPNENMLFGGSGSNRTVTITPAIGESGFADITLVVGSGPLTNSTVFRYTVMPPGIVAGTLYSDGADCSIKENLVIEKLTDASVDLGARGASPWVERCTVYVFPLPDLGAVSNPFTEASFSFNYEGKSGTLRGNDLYGLGRRASSAVLTSDFYSQTATPDPTDATRLQESILIDSTPFGLVGTSMGGGSNLMNYLNAQYAGGAGVGEYVFLRLNTRSAKTGINFATLTMSEGGVAGPVDTRPQISYQAVGNTAPYIMDIPDQTIDVNTNTGPIAFIVGDDADPGLITLSGNSTNTTLVPPANIVFGGSGSNRTVTVTPAAGQGGDAEIIVVASDGSLSFTNSFILTVLLPSEVVAGWDVWDSAATPNASVLSPDITASAVTTSEQVAWNATDERGASNDGTWGTLEGPPSASIVTNANHENLTLPNATTGGTITFTVSNNGTDEIELDSFHFDAYAFRPKAPRTYELSVLAGSGITTGIVFTSAADAITSVNGAWDNGAHDDIDIDLAGLTDHTLGAGESVDFLLAFSGGEGDDSGGHHLFVDNVAISRVAGSSVEPPVLEYSFSGGNMVFTWTGSGFRVQSRTNLTEGIWLDVPGGDVPPVNVAPTNSADFFRLIEN
ncbi:BNR repeat-containing protein [Pontiellaceae bacterium B12227]|nr:BNR repeat-containing protein [Pontiellaceae bacterium B12227]